jgi:hypothetical protein
MELVVKVLSTTAAGATWFWSAIPAGVGMGLPPVVSGVAAALGNLAAVGLVVLAEGRVEHWVSRYRGYSSKHAERLKRLWTGYGLGAVALVSPLLVGAPLGTALALLLGAPPRKLFVYMCLSVVLWGVVLTVAAIVGDTALRG